MRSGRTLALAVALAVWPRRARGARRPRRSRGELQRDAAGQLGQRRRRASRRACGSRRPPAGCSATTAGAASARRSRRAPSGAPRSRRRRCWPTARRSSAMPTVWSAQQFTPPRWSADGGATWHAGGAARGRCALRLRRRSRASSASRPVTADPADPRTAWFCQGNLYVTHDAGRTWAVATPRLKRPWHCAALAIAPGRPHTLILLVQSKAKNPKRVPGRLLRSVNGGATWQPRRRRRASRSSTTTGTRSRSTRREPSTALMIGAHGATLGALYRSRRRRPVTGSACGRRARCAAPSSTSSRSPRDGRALALVRIGDRQQRDVRLARRRRALERSRPSLALGAKSPADLRLAARSERHVVPARHEPRGFWRLAPGARRWGAAAVHWRCATRAVGGPAPLRGRPAARPASRASSARR